MSKLIEDAVRALRELPEDAQQAAALAIINYEAGYDDDVQLSDDQVAEIGWRIAHPDRKFISLTELGQTYMPSRRMRVVIDECAWSDLHGITAWIGRK